MCPPLLGACNVGDAGTGESCELGDVGLWRGLQAGRQTCPLLFGTKEGNHENAWVQGSELFDDLHNDCTSKREFCEVYLQVVNKWNPLWVARLFLRLGTLGVKGG